MKYIDAHAHLVHGHRGFHELVDSGEFDEIWLMDLDGMVINGIQLAATGEVLQAMKDHPQVVYGFAHLDFDKEVDQIDRFRDMGFTGLKPYKPKTNWNDQRYYPFYERAEKEGMPILFHTGIVAKTGGVNRRENPEYGFGAEGMRPSYLSGIAEAFPDLQIIGGHLGYPWFEETAQNLYYYPNIVHDISGYRHPEFLEKFFKSLDRMTHDGTQRRFHEKVFFATDQFYGIEEQNRNALKFKQFWTLFHELVFQVYTPWGAPAEMEKFFYGNAHNWRMNLK